MIFYILVWYFSFGGEEYEGQMGFMTYYECEAAKEMLMSDEAIKSAGDMQFNCVSVQR